MVVGESDAVWDVFRRLYIWATKGSRTLLLLGPSGAGKTHLAELVGRGKGCLEEFAAHGRPNTATDGGGRKNSQPA